MKKIAILIAFALVIQFFYPAAILAQGINQSKNMVIPKDKVILVELLDELNSGVNKEGDTFRFETRENVLIDNIVVIPYGTRGVGTLNKVKRAGAWGKGGYFDINFGSISSINNTPVPVELGKSAQGAQKQFAGTVLPIIGALVFLPLLLFGFTKGDEAKLAKGAQFYINVRNDVDLGMAPQSDLASAMPKDEKFFEKSAEEIKKSEPSVVVDNYILCKKISSTGDPVEVSNVFKSDAGSVAVVVFVNNLKEKTSVTVKWNNAEGLFYAKQIDIPKGNSKITDTLLKSKNQTFKEGLWKIEVEQDKQIIKIIEFSVVK